MVPAAIRHVFVLMLENRSFDHVLGYTLAADDLPEVSDADGQRSLLKNQLPAAIRPDPPHEADDIFWQLTGSPATTGCSYASSRVTGAGFAACYADFLRRNPRFLDQPGQAAASIRDAVISGYRDTEVPVLATLARQFQACTRWHASLPGPTWPNRFFAHAGTSGGFYCSPSDWQSITATLVKGFSFAKGTLYDRLDDAGIRWRVYHGDALPQVLALKGFNPARLAVDGRMVGFGSHNDLRLKGDYPYGYTFIEPNYGHDLQGDASTMFGGGNSQHPVGSIADGEQLIRDVYTQIGAAGLWDSSVLIVTYDEHGGFFDRWTDLSIPASAGTDSDRSQAKLNRAKVAFDFSLYGVRVPAVVVSPWLGAGLCDTVFDHCTIGRTLRDVFAPLRGLPDRRFTDRVNSAHSLATLPWLSQARSMPTLPTVNRTFQHAAAATMRLTTATAAARRREPDRLDHRHFAAIALAARARAEVTKGSQSPQRIARELASIDTVTKAKLYLSDTKSLIDRHTILAHARKTGARAPVDDWVPPPGSGGARGARGGGTTKRRPARKRPRRTR